MRVLYFSSDNNKTSGAFICMVQQIMELKKRFNVKSYVVLPFDGDGKYLLEKNNIPWSIIKSKHWMVNKNQSGIERIKTDIKMSIKFCLNLFSIRKSARLIRDFAPDIIHLNTTFCYIGAVAAKQCGVPFVWHLREIVEEGMGKKIWNRNYGYNLINQANCIICVSNSVKNTYYGILQDSKMKVIYDGIEVSKYPFQIEKDNDCISLACIGALGEHKGQETIIQACNLLKKRNNILFKLYIIGRGPAEEKYRKLISDLDLSDCVELSGSQNNVEDYYHKAHFTIVNGYKEGFGRVTVEAMLCGSYVIGCDTGGTSELIQGGKYGIMFEHNNVEDLYQKLVYAIEHKETIMKERMKCRMYALTNFTSERNANNIYSVYERIISERRNIK